MTTTKSIYDKTESMSKHTPGPWSASEEFDDNESLGIAITAGRRRQVVRVFDISQEGFANAALIAAAPDLLAVLEHVLDRATMPGFLRDKVKAAIVKATGATA